MNYTHITQDERYQIYILKKAGHTQRAIAKLINRSPSSVSRELNRNTGKRGYRPQQAQQKATERHAKYNAVRIDQETWDSVNAQLALHWSPEQISGYRRCQQQSPISHERIYQHIYANKRSGGELYTRLRCQKLRKKRYGKRERRGTIPNQVSIEQRPAVVHERTRYGDWEVDLVIGANHQQALVTLNERKSRYTLITKVERKTAESVAQAMLTLLAPLQCMVHTVTSDNGREFAQHERVAQSLNADYFFAHPYCSWERGANENMNGLIRQFFPKKMRFETITQDDIVCVMDRLNHRPRKCLNYKTPHEIFIEQLKLHQRGVALQS